MDLNSLLGILSYFAVQAGAKHVYAVEASSMASKIQKMIDSTKNGKNTWLFGKITVFQGNFIKFMEIF